MNSNAVPQTSLKARFLVALLAAAMLLACFGAAAAVAAPVGSDGQIHACYRVKGKPKGALRVVAGARTHCKRGERKAVWSVAGQSGQAGRAGDTGSTGAAQPGDNGSNGTSASEAALKAQISGLTLKVDSLESLLQGVTDGDLSGLLARVGGMEGLLEGVEPGDLANVLSTLEGVTNEKLQETIDALPLLNEVCAQSAALTTALNTTLAGLVAILGVKTPVAPITCPAPAP